MLHTLRQTNELPQFLIIADLESLLDLRWRANDEGTLRILLLDYILNALVRYYRGHHRVHLRGVHLVLRVREGHIEELSPESGEPRVLA